MDCVDCQLWGQAAQAAGACGCCGAAVCDDHVAQDPPIRADVPVTDDPPTGSKLMCELCARIIAWQCWTDDELADS